ncbi:hypothetical protein LTR04_001039, partial [Oleoguttula sp. CCFEE 6159]
TRARVHTRSRSPHYGSATRAATRATSGGTLVSATMTVPNRLMDSEEKAAARGSEASSSAVATADEFEPSVTPRVM